MKRSFVWALGGLFAFLAAIVLYEIVVFALSNEARALDVAKVEFVKECTRNGLNPAEFGDPQQTKRQDRAYEFVWKNPSNGDEIRALVGYLPAGAEALLIRGEDMRAIKDRFKLN